MTHFSKQITLKTCFNALYKNGLGGSLILTRNQRQARHLKQQWLAAQTKDVKLVAAPNIQPIDQWVSLQWQRITAQPVLAKDTSFCMMLDTISQLDAKPHTTPLASASMALTALGLLTQYRSNWQALETYHTDEQIAWFLQYCKAFETASQHVSVTHGYQCEELLTRHIRQQSLSDLPKTIYLFGFIRFAPQLDTLLSALAEAVEIVPVKEQPRTDQYHMLCL